MADFFAFEADKINSVYALVDFLAIEDPASEFLNTNAEQLFIILLDLAPARFVTWQIFVFAFIMAGVVKIVIRPTLGRSS